MNAYAADYDETHFKDAYSFNPDRYLNVNEGVSGTAHYAYGAGSRMCAGSHLANRELYTAFIRLICAFEMTLPRDKADMPVMDCLGANALPTSLTMEPKKFKCGFKVRDRRMLDVWMKEGEERFVKAQESG